LKIKNIILRGFLQDPRDIFLKVFYVTLPQFLLAGAGGEEHLYVFPKIISVLDWRTQVVTVETIAN
jgi:hypothetical protein